MKTRLTTLFIALGICLGTQAQITVDNTLTLDEAIAVMLGPGVEFSNVTFSGGNEQFGGFNSTAANVGIDTGIILATGGITAALGPNNASAAGVGGGNFGASDPDLDELDGLTHNDAAILEFDFVATGSSVSFDYVFASEEYPEYTGAGSCGDVSDVFGFFLSGPGITGGFSNNAINIALIPGSNPAQFVSIHNLNAGCDGLATPGSTYCNYCELYVNNGDGFTAPFNTDAAYVQYDGLTVILTAFYEGLQCGETYHIKLALADVSDTAFDSAVFLKEGSFNVTGTFIEANVIDPSEILGDAILLEGCINGAVVIHPPGCVEEGLEVQLETSGIAINGIDYEPLPSTIVLNGEDIILPLTTIYDNLVEGTESFIISMIYMNQDGVLDTATATLDLLDYIAPSVIVEEVFICGESENAEPLITGGFAPYEYAWSSGEITPIANYVEGDAGEYSVAISDFCGSEFGTTFNVIEPEPFVVNEDIDLCFGMFSGPLAEGGGLPYTVIYPEDSLVMDDYGFTALEEGIFVVYFEDQCGSTGISVIDSHICDTVVPNIFTPDGDGKNDMFHIYGIEGFPNSTLMVFDRWGKKVFEDEDYKNTWSGGDIADGVLYYIFKRSDGKVYDGHVHKIGSK